MSTIVLFHSALGLRPAVRRFADDLRSDGHVVHTPDLYEGEVFERLEEGVARYEALGFPALLSRAHRALEGLPREVFYAGFSLGAVVAQYLAATQPGARGAVLMHGAEPLDALGVDAWPSGVPVQIHAAVGDPWVEPSVVEGLEALGFDAHRYPGGGHLFADEQTADYAPESAAAMRAAILRFVR